MARSAASVSRGALRYCCAGALVVAFAVLAWRDLRALSRWLWVCAGVLALIYIDRQVFGRVLDELAEDSEKCECGRALILYADDHGRCMPCHRPDLYRDQRAFSSARNLRRAA